MAKLLSKDGTNGIISMASPLLSLICTSSHLLRRYMQTAIYFPICRNHTCAVIDVQFLSCGKADLNSSKIRLNKSKIRAIEIDQ